MLENRIDLTEVRDSIERLKVEIGKIIVGQERLVNLMITALLSNGHIIIEGYPGLAKTLAAKVLAKSISVKFSRIQFTPDLMPSDILGTSIFNQQKAKFEFKKGPIFSNLVLIDEINRAPAKTQSALFEVMEERQVTMDSKTYKMKKPYMIIATQNPIDFEGTYRLPEAQLDRFLFKINIGYPSLEEEEKIISDYNKMGDKNDMTKITPVITSEELMNNQKVVQQIIVEEKLIAFIAQIVQKTRHFKDIEIGASPRASLAILASSKATALMKGRDFVIPDDILEVAAPVLNHRITLSPEKEMEGLSPEKVIRILLKTIDIPR